jgi:uncharacterized coiled-coil protein SlyX
MANAVQKLEGRLHALKKKIAKQDEVIEELGSELGNAAGDLAEIQGLIRALKNPDIIVNGAPSLTLDRVQVMENGDIRVLPPSPSPIVTGVGIASADETCVVVPEPEKNGAKPEKEAVSAG